MSYTTMLGVVAYYRDSNKDRETQTWFEGFTHGLHEADALTDEEKDNILELLPEITKGEK